MGITMSKEFGLNPTIAVCYLGGKPKNEIALLGTAYKKNGKTAEAPMYLCLDKKPCDKGKEYMKKGVILIEVVDGGDRDNPERTGGFYVIKPEAMERIFGSVPEKRVAFIEASVVKKLKLPKPKKEVDK